MPAGNESPPSTPSVISTGFAKLKAQKVKSLMMRRSSSSSHPKSQSQSPSPFYSRRGLSLICYAFPQSESQPDKPNSWRQDKRPHWIANAISDQEVVYQFDQLLAAKNLREINQYLKDYTKTSNNPYPTVLSLFTRLTQAEGIGPDS